MLSVKDINLLQAQNEGLKKQNAELQKENAKLKEEIKIIDNLSEKFRKEALSWANIANGYQKDKTKLEQTLQEIKKIAERNIFLSPKLLEINGDIGQIQNIAITQILDLITKADEE